MGSRQSAISPELGFPEGWLMRSIFVAITFKKFRATIFDGVPIIGLPEGSSCVCSVFSMIYGEYWGAEKATRLKKGLARHPFRFRLPLARCLVLFRFRRKAESGFELLHGPSWTSKHSYPRPQPLGHPNRTAISSYFSLQSV